MYRGTMWTPQDTTLMFDVGPAGYAGNCESPTGNESPLKKNNRRSGRFDAIKHRASDAAWCSALIGCRPRVSIGCRWKGHLNEIKEHSKLTRCLPPRVRRRLVFGLDVAHQSRDGVPVWLFIQKWYAVIICRGHWRTENYS